MTALRASDLYALSQGDRNRGNELCHWCGASTQTGRDRHDDKIVGIPGRSKVKFDQAGIMSGGVNNPLKALYPSEPWICRGCWLWRRPRIDVVHLSGNIRPKQSPIRNSWLVSERMAGCVAFADFKKLYDFLLVPCRRFFLSLIREGDKVPNHLHQAVINDFDRDVQMGDSLSFTLNNTPMTYTPYELEQALRRGPSGKEPGVRALVALLGPCELPEEVITDQHGNPRTYKEGESRGKPPLMGDGKTLKKPVGK